MSKLIEVEGVGLVEFDDGATDEVIGRSIRRLTRQSTSADVGSSVRAARPRELGEGTARTGGLPSASGRTRPIREALTTLQTEPSAERGRPYESSGVTQEMSDALRAGRDLWGVRPITPPSLDDAQPDASIGGVMRRAAAGNIAPTAAGIAAFQPGFNLGLRAPIPHPVGRVGVALGTGLAASLGAGYLALQGQEEALEAVPAVRDVLGQSPEQMAADEAAHPNWRFLAQMAPSLAFFRPSISQAPVREGATALERVFANPWAGAGISGSIGAAQEGGRQLATGEDLNLERLAVAFGGNALMNRPTALGQSMMDGTSSMLADAVAGTARGAGRAYGAVRDRVAPEPGPDFANMRSAGSSTTADGSGAFMNDIRATTLSRQVPRIEGPAPRAPVTEAVTPAPPVRPVAPARAPQMPAENGTPAPPPEAAQPPVQPVEAPEPSPAPTGRLPDPGELGEREAYVSTAQGDRVRTRFEVVEADALEQASGDLQNRDRTRASTDVQIQDIIGKFDPARLGDSAEADRGAPIVGPDGVIESGNGRVMALRRIYEQYPEQAAAYRRFLDEQGYPTEGVNAPVLVRIRTSELDPDQRRQFVVDANRSAILEMTATERARSDRDILDGDTLAMYRGGDLDAAGNRSFVMAFQKRLPASEQGAVIDGEGRLSQAGVKRVENALMARAYENPEILEKLLEARDNNIRSIGGAMLDVSGGWGSMRAAAADGTIKPEFDVTERLVEAARMVSDARAAGTKINDLLAQQGMFGDTDPVTEQFVRAFYRANLKSAAGRDAIRSVLESYITRAGEQTTAPRLFGGDDGATPEGLLRTIMAERDGSDTGDMFATAAEDRAPAPKKAASRVSRGALADALGGKASPVARERVYDLSEADLADDADQPVLDYTAGAAKDAGPYDPEFMNRAFTSRESIYETAVAEMGYDLAKFRLLPGPKQIRLLQQAMMRKFGIKVTIKPGMQDRFAIDQMLDAFQNVQGMAHILGIPNVAMSLKGGLTLGLQKKAGWLGTFWPGENAIRLPGRSNSFAHEWGHALDWHLLRTLGDGSGKGFSGAIRQRGEGMSDGKLAPSRNVREAFIDLLNVMFFDKAALAARAMELEGKIASTKSDKQRAKFQSELDRIYGGGSQMKGGRTLFYRNAKAADGPGDEGSKTYWASPTEMFARSFEAYVANRVDMQGLSTEFISKGDAAYLSNADDRFRTTFPKDGERALIFAAMDVVFQKIAAESLLGRGTAAAMPDTVTSTRAEVNAPIDRAKTGNWFSRAVAREMGGIDDWVIRRAKAAEGRPNDPKGTLEKLQDIGSIYGYGMTAKVLMIGRRYKAPTVKRLHDMLTHNTGDGGYSPRGLIQATRLRENGYINRIDRAITNASQQIGRRVLTPDEDKILRDLLISETVPGAPAYLVALAKDLRRLEDEIFYDLQRAGIDVGYTRNGHLHRMVDVPKVLNDEAGFIERASEVYEIQFDKTWDGPDAILADGEKMAKFLKLARRMKSAGHPVDVKSINKALRAIRKAEADGDAAQVAALTAQLEKEFPDFFDAVRTAYTEQAARDWLSRIRMSGIDDFDKRGPDAKFSKKRVLPPEADKILEDFYINDPIEVIATYAQKAARRIEYATRFGHDNKKLDAMYERMSNEGVPSEEINAIKFTMAMVSGNHPMRLHVSENNLVSAVQTLWGTITLLPRAVLLSLVEATTAGIVTGNVKYGAKAMIDLFAGALGTASAKERREIARFIGLIETMNGSQILLERFGGSFGGVTRWDRIAANMFRNSGLTALTRGQQTHMIGVAHAFIDALSHRITKGLDSGTGPNGAPDESSWTWKDSQEAIARYRELGIRDPEAFAREMVRTGRLPTIDELAAGQSGENAYAFDWTTAVTRMVDQIIQNPSVMDRPQGASSLFGSPVLGRFTYGIMSFLYAQWRNIIKGSAKRYYNQWKRSGTAYTAAHVAFGLLPAVALLWFGQFIVTVGREYFTNRKRWEDRKAEGTLAEELIFGSLSRTFGTPLDPAIQAYSGLRYQRDITAAPLGPALGNGAQNLQDILELFSSNTPNTNTREYNALRGFYRLGVAPLLSAGVSSIPGGAIINGSSGVANGLLTAPVAADEFAAMFVGESDGRKRLRRSAERRRAREAGGDDEAAAMFDDIANDDEAFDDAEAAGQSR